MAEIKTGNVILKKTTRGWKRLSRKSIIRSVAMLLVPSFILANLRELAVHHIDHDHTNNPEDGSNWELLCLFATIIRNAPKQTCPSAP